MAKPRETAKPDPPVESEEEEEEESGEEEEEGSESESEAEPETPQKKVSSAPPPAPRKPEPQTPKTQPAADASSSGEEESESGSDSDSETPIKTTIPNIKPIASKPMDDPQKTNTTTKKPRSKPNSSIPTSPTKPTSGTGAKRPATAEVADEGKDAKKSKKKPESEAESSEKKGKLFQRLWSEDDEIAILKGMIDYSAKKKADPVTDLNDFHEFIKKNLHIDVSRTQLQDKIRRLRKKYENIAKKERKGNKERTFSKAHEQKTYDFSKKIWGKEKNGNNGDDDKVSTESQKINEVNGTVVRKSRSKSVVGVASKDDEAKEEKVKDLVNEKNISFGYPSMGIEEWAMKSGMEFIKDVKKRGELEEKWKELRVKEIELLARRSELMAEQAKLILDGFK